MTDKTPASDRSGRPRFLHRTSTGNEVCRCGTRAREGDVVLEIAGLSGTPADLLRGLVFCSDACVRAWFLETLIVFEQLDTPEAGAIVTDLRKTYLALIAVFSMLLGDLRSE